MVQILLVIAALLAVCFLILYINSLQKYKAAKALAAQLQENAGQQITALKSERDQFLNEKITLGRELTEQTTRNDNLQEHLLTQAWETEKMQTHFKQAFENLANQLLDEKSEKFTKQNQTNIEGLLKPLKEKMKEFEQKVEETYNRESRERFSLQKELQRMFELNQTLSEQANNLTNALKADTRQQGHWGEYLLERVLQAAGLEADIHYRKQVSVNDADGAVKRPDLVILLPDSRHVIVDAKVSLTAYERYFNATTPEEQQRAARDHILSVKRHIDELHAKCYDKLFEPSPDFVLMFIPVEPAYSLALMQEQRLFEEAYRKRVILVSISSLLATLRIIEAMWRLEKQNRNAADIVNKGGQLYEKIVGFVEDMQSLGQKLGSAEKTFSQAMNKLAYGRGSVIRKAEAMRKLGLDPKKQLPADLIKAHGEEEEDDDSL